MSIDKMDKDYRIMFAGPSGCGKTTVSKLMSKVMDIPFISGSVSDLIPSTKDIPHKDMLNHDYKELEKQDYQIVNLRNKLFKDKDNFITDRSYLDSAAYFTYKQSEKNSQCEIDSFLGLCKMLLNKQCTHLIFFNFPPYMIKEWYIEDNGKRILNKFFQSQIASIMFTILKYWDINEEFNNKICWGILRQHTKYLLEGYYIGELKSVYGSTKVLIINECNYKTRLELIKYFLKNE